MRLLLTSLAAGFIMMTGAAVASAQDCAVGPCNDCSTNQCQSSLFDRQRSANGHTGWQNPHLVSKAYHKTMSCLFTGPYPSNAPTIRPQGQLAFPSHPYVRSPRDFFMSE